jgi:death-on-curing protein
VTLHDRTIADHGGSPGIRDDGLLEAALARPQSHFLYVSQRDLPTLAAVYAAAITSNHPFIDGNKCAAFFAAGLFLEKNGLWLIADQVSAALTVFRLAAGEISSDEMAAWIAAHAVPSPPAPAAA